MHDDELYTMYVRTHRVNQAKMVNMDHQEVLDHVETPVRMDHQESKDRRVHQDQTAPGDHLEQMVHVDFKYVLYIHVLHVHTCISQSVLYLLQLGTTWSIW